MKFTLFFFENCFQETFHKKSPQNLLKGNMIGLGYPGLGYPGLDYPGLELTGLDYPE